MPIDEDPNAALFGEDEEENQEELIYNQIYKKTPKRVEALHKLCFDGIMETLKEVPEEAKSEMLFKLTATTVLDMLSDAADVDAAMDLSFSLDMYMGVALTNVRYGVNLFEELQKALAEIEPSDFANDEEYERRVADFEEAWWDIPQPRLEKRNPNDAIRESLSMYGLDQ